MQFFEMLQKFTSSIKTALSTDTQSLEPPQNLPDQEEDFFDQYDDIACMICEQDYPLVDFGIDMTNIELCGQICDDMDVEYFDMFAEIVPDDALKSESAELVRATAFIYLLRFQVFSVAKHEGLGDDAFNEAAIAHSEAWYLRLTGRYGQLTSGNEPDKTWIN